MFQEMLWEILYLYMNRLMKWLEFREIKGHLDYFPCPHTPMSESILHHSWQMAIQSLLNKNLSRKLNYPKKAVHSTAGLLSFFNKVLPYNWTKNLFLSKLLILSSFTIWNIGKTSLLSFLQDAYRVSCYPSLLRLTQLISNEEVSRVLTILITLPWIMSSVPLKMRCLELNTVCNALSSTNV